MGTDRITYLARSHIVNGFEPLVKELGGDPAELYRKAGLSASLFDDPGMQLPSISLVKLLDMAARELQRADFGLLLGCRRKALSESIPGLLFMQSPDVRAALKTLTEHFHLVNESIDWRLEEHGDLVSLFRYDHLAAEAPTFQYTSKSVAQLTRALRNICGDSWQPSSVHFNYAAPSCVREYNRLFGQKVLFDRQYTCIVFPAADLDRPVRGHNRDYHSILARQIAEIEEDQPGKIDFRTRVKLLIRHKIQVEECTQASLAAMLGLHPKKLQRELNRHGVTFRELRAEARLDVAEHLLKDSNMSQIMLSEILGFSEPSVFARAFKIRHGVSPTAWRKKAAARNPAITPDCR